MSDEVIEQFQLGSIKVEIRKTDDPDRYLVHSHDDTYQFEFTVRKYEYENYNRLMKKRIKDTFKQQYGEG